MNELERLDIIKDIVTFVNSKSQAFALKGGTAMVLCYGADIITDDINFDVVDRGADFERIISNYCIIKGYSFETEHFVLTNRYSLTYDDADEPIMIEISNRRAHAFDRDFIAPINGVLTYKISMLLNFAVLSYCARQRDSDLFMIVYICEHHWGNIDNRTRALTAEALSYNGHKPFDTLNKVNSGIDIKALEKAYEGMYKKLEFNKLRPRIKVEVTYG